MKVSGKSKAVGDAGIALSRWQFSLRRQPDGTSRMWEADLVEYSGRPTNSMNLSINDGGPF